MGQGDRAISTFPISLSLTHGQCKVGTATQRKVGTATQRKVGTATKRKVGTESLTKRQKLHIKLKDEYKLNKLYVKRKCERLYV